MHNFELEDGPENFPLHLMHGQRSTNSPAQRKGLISFTNCTRKDIHMNTYAHPSSGEASESVRWTEGPLTPFLCLVNSRSQDWKCVTYSLDIR
ncbi:hypothetical protein PoB_006231700 [Plakobranchus ocellatus]|uniref:Uncharacterized protein n=1 Tax=Plakobranchus ocellatus TaxID=259542 RepID=A0AAV4CV70_9GAST|nr:hypothetical protein PoB_006231700 [Plakobranchus ocellatus]